MSKSKPAAALISSEPTPVEPNPSEGGSYVIENGVRRLVERTEFPDLMAPAPPADPAAPTAEGA